MTLILGYRFMVQAKDHWSLFTVLHMFSGTFRRVIHRYSLMTLYGILLGRPKIVKQTSPCVFPS